MNQQELINSLIEVIKKFAEHKEECALINYLNDDADCTCGLYQAIACDIELLKYYQSRDKLIRFEMKHRCALRSKQLHAPLLKEYKYLLKAAGLPVSLAKDIKVDKSIQPDKYVNWKQ